MGLWVQNVFAYDFSVKNADGVTIYYNYINDSTELEVTYENSIYKSNTYSGVVSIPDEVTYSNKTLKVTSIGKSAFYKCEELSSVIIPSLVTSIGDSAFNGCSALTSIEIPNSVTDIGNGAFTNCYNLSSVSIGSNVTNIGVLAFESSSNISIIVSKIENPFPIDDSRDTSTFNNKTFNHAVLYVPGGTVDKYKTADGWKNFANIKEGLPSGIDKVDNNNKIIKRYSLNGYKSSTSKNGIYVIQMDNGITKKVVLK